MYWNKNSNTYNRKTVKLKFLFQLKQGENYSHLNPRLFQMERNHLREITNIVFIS